MIKHRRHNMSILKNAMVLLCLVSFSSSAVAIDNIWISEKDGPIKVAFDTNGYVFYKGTDGIMGSPVQAFFKLVAVKGDKKIILPKTTSFKSYASLNKPEEALAFVRLFTNLDTHYLFKDSDWIEVFNGKTDILGGEMYPGGVFKNDWEKFGLFEPKITTTADGFLIERCLLNSKKEIFHSEERVGIDGEYSMKIKSIIQKNSEAPFPWYE